MPDLCRPSEISALLKEFGLSPKKYFGQNFLIDANILGKIISSAQINNDDIVIEIGAGLGTLTAKLCETARHVISYEIDTSLLPVLGKTLGAYTNLTLINADIMKSDICAELAGIRELRAGSSHNADIANVKPCQNFNFVTPGLTPNPVDLKLEKNRLPSLGSSPRKNAQNDSLLSVKVVANLPYYITTPIMMYLLESSLPLSSITVMVQKEVAERICAKPGTKAYGALSVAVNYRALPRIAAIVPAGAFMPKPTVDSVVLQMDIYHDKPVVPSDEAFMFRIIRAVFETRRKTLCNSIANCPQIGVSKARVVAALQQMGLSEDIRGERLSVSDFAIFSSLLATAEK
jgi:16S rRNA (adenine1518-N6/adenine1519-N6)-dimethyltransferase